MFRAFQYMAFPPHPLNNTRIPVALLGLEVRRCAQWLGCHRQGKTPKDIGEARVHWLMSNYVERIRLQDGHMQVARACNLYKVLVEGLASGGYVQGEPAGVT